MFRMWQRVAEIKLESSRFQAVFGFIDLNSYLLLQYSVEATMRDTDIKIRRIWNIAFREATADQNGKENRRERQSEYCCRLNVVLMNRIEIFRHLLPYSFFSDTTDGTQSADFLTEYSRNPSNKNVILESTKPFRVA